MKTLAVLFVLALAANVNAQLLVDDFTSGNLDKVSFNQGQSELFYQSNAQILGGTRRIQSNVSQNPFDQGMHLSVTNGLMAITSGYNTRGTIILGYGHNENGHRPLNEDVSQYASLKMKFDAKSAVSNIFVSLYTDPPPVYRKQFFCLTSNENWLERKRPSQAVYSGDIPAQEEAFEFTIPLSEFNRVGEKFTMAHVNYIRMQFELRSKTGCNMAIDKIWFE